MFCFCLIDLDYVVFDYHNFLISVSESRFFFVMQNVLLSTKRPTDVSLLGQPEGRRNGTVS